MYILHIYIHTHTRIKSKITVGEKKFTLKKPELKDSISQLSLHSHTGHIGEDRRYFHYHFSVSTIICLRLLGHISEFASK